MQRCNGAARSIGAPVRTEISRAIFVKARSGEQAAALTGLDFDEAELVEVAQPVIELRIVRPHELGFQKQRLEFRAGDRVAEGSGGCPERLHFGAGRLCGGGIGAKPLSQIFRFTHIDDAVACITQCVHTGLCRSRRKLAAQHGRPYRQLRRIDDTPQRRPASRRWPDPQVIEQGAQREHRPVFHLLDTVHEELRRRSRIGKRTMVPFHVDAKLAGQRAEFIVGHLGDGASRERKRIKPDIGERWPAVAAEFRVDEMRVEPHVMSDDDGVAEELDDRGQHLTDRRRVGDHRVGDAREVGDEGWNGLVRVDESAERARDASSIDADQSDLGDAIAARYGACGLKVDDRERYIPQIRRAQRSKPGVVKAPEQTAVRIVLSRPDANGDAWGDRQRHIEHTFLRTYVRLPIPGPAAASNEGPRSMPQVFFLHGSGHTGDSFKNQAEAFPGSVALSLPGHPQGSPLESVCAYADWVARRVKDTASKAIVAGNSLGGAIALQWALDHPEQAAGIVLIGSGARLRVSSDIFAMIDGDWPRCVDTLVDWSLASDATAALRERAKSWHLLVGKNTTRTDYAACNRFDVMGRLSELRLPVLIIVGASDRMTPEKYSTFLHEHIAGSELAVVPGAGHLVMAEQPARTNALLASFFERVS